MTVSRRTFLSRSTVGLATAGALAAVPGLATLAKLPVDPEAAPLEGDQLVAHVRSVSSGDITLLVGTTEVVYRDKAIAQRLARAAAGAGR